MWAWHVKMATQNLLKFTHWLDWRANSKLVEVGTFANVDDEDRVGNSLLHTCCILGSWGLVIKPNFCSDFEHKVWSRFWCWSSGKIFRLAFGQYFAADVLQRLWSWILVEMLKLGLVFWIPSLVELVMFSWDFEVNAGSRFWRWSLIKICVWTCE